MNTESGQHSKKLTIKDRNDINEISLNEDDSNKSQDESGNYDLGEDNYESKHQSPFQSNI